MTPAERTNDGGPAFPHLHNTCQRVNETEMFPGMTLRDYFAAAALTGMYLADELARQHCNPGGTRTTAAEYAASAFQQADAMLKAREGGAS